MMVHLYLFGKEAVHEDTSRVTMLEDGTPHGHAGRVLILGTKPDVKIYPLLDVQWFWVEEN